MPCFTIFCKNVDIWISFLKVFIHDKLQNTASFRSKERGVGKMGGKKRNRAGYFKVLYKMGSKTWAEPVIKKLKPVIKKLKTGSFDI